jgi:hypothetical protein
MTGRDLPSARVLRRTASVYSPEPLEQRVIGWCVAPGGKGGGGVVLQPTPRVPGVLGPVQGDVRSTAPAGRGP